MSDYEGYRYLADEARSLFGRYINLNELFGRKYESSDSIIDLDAFDKWVETQK